MNTFSKQPREILDYDNLFSATDLPDGDTLTSSTATWVNTRDANDTTSLNLGVCKFFNDPPRWKVWLGGGLNRASYKITVASISAGGRTFEDDFLLKVKDE